MYPLHILIAALAALLPAPPVHCSKDHDNHAQRRRRRSYHHHHHVGAAADDEAARERDRDRSRHHDDSGGGNQHHQPGEKKSPSAKTPSSSPNKALPQKCDPIHSPQRVVACRGNRPCRGIHDWAPVFKGVVRVRARARRQVLPHEVVPQRGRLISCWPMGGGKDGGICAFFEGMKGGAGAGEDVDLMVGLMSDWHCGCARYLDKLGGVVIDYVEDVKHCNGSCVAG